MRRLMLLAASLLALSFTSCLGYRSWQEPPPFPRGGRSGSQAAPCREVGRIHCAVERCKGTNLDWVELQCGGTRTGRCVITKGCGVPDEEQR